MTLTQITEKGIKDGEIINADINASAAIAGSKIDPSFTSNITVSGTDPRIIFTDTNNNPDFTLHANGGEMQVENSGSGTQVKLESSGSTRVYGNLIANANLTVDTNTLHVDSSNNLVGIGTTSPNSNFKLDVNGAARIGNTTDGIIIENSTSNPSVSNACRIHRNGATGELNITSGTTTARNMIFNTKTSGAESMRITSTGNVGIGTTSPSQKLHVSGDVLIAGGAGGTLLLGGSAAHTSKLVIGSNDGSSNGNLLVEGGDGGDFFTINSAGNVKFEDNKKALFGAGADLEIYHDSVGSIIQNGTGPTIIKGSGSNVDIRNSNDEIMIRCNGGDAVDIRHANSNRILTTSSGITFSGNDNSFNAGANAVNTTFSSAFGGAGATSVIRVKMNTSAVHGIQIQQAGSGTAVAGGNHAATFFNTENAKLRLGTNNVEQFRIENNGDLKGTDTSIGSLSDSRLKKNIVDFTYDLSKFKQFKPRKFDWINPELHGNKSDVRGFLAQEIEVVDSTLVGDYTLYDETLTDKNPDLAIIEADDGTNIAKDSKLGTNDAMYISVIQQMLTKIETLETKVAALVAA